jgi:hypothetical protein
VADILERGDIVFFFRPRVRDADRGRPPPPGVQSFFAVLIPGRGPARRLRIGRNRLPVAGQRHWAQVERTGSLDEVLAGQLDDEEYVTRTRGVRFQPAARAIAEGSYALVGHGDHSHLAFRVERREGGVPGELRVPETASYVLLFKRAGGGARWTAEGDPAQLGEQGAEIVLIATRDEPEQALGIDLLSA